MIDAWITLEKAKKFLQKTNGELAPLSFPEEDLNPQIQDDVTLRVVPIEDTDSCYSVGYKFPDLSDQSEISFFEDGKQQTIQIGFIPATIGSTNVIIPVHFFVAAAVILKREQRKLTVWDTPEVRSGILIEKSLVPDQKIIEGFMDMGLNIVDTKGEGGDYYELKRRALQETKRQRLELENRLIERWGDSAEARNEFILVDGTLMNLRVEKHLHRCIAVSKSFSARYFQVSTHNRIMQMDEYERSCVFRFHPADDQGDDLSYGQRERISWYLRIRKLSNVQPEFGLVRIEISKDYAPNASREANRFSRSVISERLPTNYPSPHWDNNLYPVIACEGYLRSIVPSTATISASMKG